MAIAFNILAMALAANAVVAFFIAFYWQARVICGLGNWQSKRANFGRFIAGDFRPDLKSKWLKAIRYVAISYAALFAVAGGLKLLAPQLLW